MVILSGLARNEPRSRRIPFSFEGAGANLSCGWRASWQGALMPWHGILRLRFARPTAFTSLRMTIEFGREYRDRDTALNRSPIGESAANIQQPPVLPEAPELFPITAIP
jgi:hypothetical protein